MRSAFKHPQIYSDIIRFHKSYWLIHQNLPKAFRQTTGEQILREVTTCLGCVASANFVNKNDVEARGHAARQLGIMRERLEVIRAFLILAWELQAVSHHGLADLNGRLDELGKQATRWQQWFLQSEAAL
jgi:hypothetical protein